MGLRGGEGKGPRSGYATGGATACSGRLATGEGSDGRPRSPAAHSRPPQRGPGPEDSARLRPLARDLGRARARVYASTGRCKRLLRSCPVAPSAASDRDRLKIFSPRGPCPHDFHNLAPTPRSHFLRRLCSVPHRKQCPSGHSGHVVLERSLASSRNSEFHAILTLTSLRGFRRPLFLFGFRVKWLSSLKMGTLYGHT